MADRWWLRPRGAEAPLPAPVGAGGEFPFEKGGVRRPHEDELGDPHPPLDAEGLLAVVVYERDPDLPAVAGVYEPRRVDQRNPVPCREPTPRQHEPRVPVGHGDRYTGPDDGPLSRPQHRPLGGDEVVACVPRVRPQGRLRSLRQTPECDPQGATSGKEKTLGRDFS